MHSSTWDNHTHPMAWSWVGVEGAETLSILLKEFSHTIVVVVVYTPPLLTLQPCVMSTLLPWDTRLTLVHMCNFLFFFYSFPVFLIITILQLFDTLYNYCPAGITNYFLILNGCFIYLMWLLGDLRCNPLFFVYSIQWRSILIQSEVKVRSFDFKAASVGHLWTQCAFNLWLKDEELFFGNISSLNNDM